MRREIWFKVSPIPWVHHVSSECPEKSIISDSTYGFGNERSDIFQKLEEESSELFENYKISTVPNDQRSKLRLEAENE